MLNKIFINYRRDDSSWPSQMIFNALNNRYSNLIFKDLKIPGGENFEKWIVKELLDCKIFICIINKDWLNELKERSGKQIDYVATEIKIALNNKKSIIPVLIDDTLMPSLNDLPEEIKGLHYKNAVRLSITNFNSGIEHLYDEINICLRNNEPLKKVLILDESAAKGSVTLSMLSQLENILNEGKSEPKCLADYFDLIVSSGPSSFIAMNLALGHFTKDVYTLFKTYVYNLFEKKYNYLFSPVKFLRASYDFKKGKQFSYKVFTNIKMRDERFKTKYCIFTYNIDLQKIQSFTNFDVTDLKSISNDVFIRDIVCGSSIYPTWHEPYPISLNEKSYRYVSGGIGLTTDLTLGTAFFIQTENDIIKWNLNADQLFFLSLGKGNIDTENAPPQGMNFLHWASRLSDYILKNFAKSNNSILKIIANNISSRYENYNFKNDLFKNISIDSYLFTLLRVDVNINNALGLRPERFRDDDLKGMDLFYEKTLNEKNNFAEFISIKKYFE